MRVSEMRLHEQHIRPLGGKRDPAAFRGHPGERPDERALITRRAARDQVAIHNHGLVKITPISSGLPIIGQFIGYAMEASHRAAFEQARSEKQAWTVTNGGNKLLRFHEETTDFEASGMLLKSCGTAATRNHEAHIFIDLHFIQREIRGRVGPLLAGPGALLAHDALRW